LAVNVPTGRKKVKSSHLDGGISSGPALKDITGDREQKNPKKFSKGKLAAAPSKEGNRRKKTIRLLQIEVPDAPLSQAAKSRS